jgi:hypothetical protein
VQSQQKQVKAVDFRQELGQALFVVVNGLAQSVHVVDGQEGMFIHRVAVIAVADNQGVDAVELGDEHLQDAKGVHGAQCLGGVGAEQHFAERVPKIRPLGDVDGQGGQGVCDAVFRSLGEGVAVGCHHGEDAQDGGGH